MMRLFEKMFYMGLGAMSLTREKTEDFFNEMIDRGEISQEEAKNTMDEWLKRGQEEKEEFRAMIREEIQSWKKDISGGVNQEQLDNLEARITELENKLK